MKFKPCQYQSFALNNEQIKYTKELLLKFQEFAKLQNIQYFAISGTLIGTVRNGGLLPWDDDIDLGILDDDVYKIESYSDSDFYFDLAEFKFGYKFKKKEHNLFIDIMVFNKDSGGTYRMINNAFPNEIFEESELFPLQTMKYSNININVPFNYKNYLDRAFNDWENKIVINCGHHSEECINIKMGTEEIINISENPQYMCYINLD